MTLFTRLSKPIIVIGISIILLLYLCKFVIFTTTQLESSSNEHAQRTLTESEQLFQQVRILCLVLTTPARHDSVAVHVLRTWGSHCNRLLFISSQEHGELETVALNVPDDEQHFWQKLVKSWRYTYRYHRHEADWFLRVEDDTFAVVENLRYLLQNYDAQQPLYFGGGALDQANFTVGSNYVLSKEALRRFVAADLPKDPEGLAEQAEILHCLQNAGVQVGDSCLKDGGTFYACQTTNFSLTSDLAYLQQGSRRLSKHAVIFEHIGSQKMYTLEYLIHKLKLFGTKDMEGY